MSSKFIVFAFAVFAAGVWTLFGPSFATAEPASPKAVVTPPQQGTTKRPLTKTDGAAFDAMRVRLRDLWLPPADIITNPEELVVVVRFSLNPDGTIAGPPKVMTVGTTERYVKARDAAVRAIFRAQPFTMLLPANYDWWKEIEITFDPRDMGRR